MVHREDRRGEKVRAGSAARDSDPARGGRLPTGESQVVVIAHPAAALFELLLWPKAGEVGPHNVDRLREQVRAGIEGATQNEGRSIVLNLQHLRRLTEDGAGLILAASNVSQSRGLDFSIANVNIGVRRMLQMMRVEKHLHIVKDVEARLAEIQRDSSSPRGVPAQSLPLRQLIAEYTPPLEADGSVNANFGELYREAMLFLQSSLRSGQRCDPDVFRRLFGEHMATPEFGQTAQSPAGIPEAVKPFLRALGKVAK